MSFKYTLRLVVFFSLFLIASSFIFCQENLEQYFDEAPLRSWNIWSPYPARNTAMGDCILAVPSRSSLSGMHNPANLSAAKQVIISCTLSVNSTQLFRYSVVNTGEVIPGVLNTSIDNTIEHFNLDHLGIIFPIKKGSIALNLAEWEDYRRPELRQAYSISTGGRIDGIFSGKLRSANLSFSYPFFKERLHIGAGFSYLYGKQSKELSLKMDSYGFEVVDEFRDEQKLKGSCFHLGLLLKVSESFKTGVALRTPFNKRAASNVHRKYSSDFITISHSYFSQDSYHQPLMIAWGLSYQLNPDLLLAADLSFFNWESYRVERFGVPLPREFRDTIKIGIGLEYIPKKLGLSFLQKLPLRIGYIRDPQPCASPECNYHYITIGTKFTIKNLSLDIAAQIGRGRGDDINLLNRRIIISLDLGL